VGEIVPRAEVARNLAIDRAALWQIMKGLGI
jgi:hypothetical protein